MAAQECIFCAIAQGAIPAEKLYDDGTVFAIADLSPVAPTHLLLIPHAHVDALADENVDALNAAARCLAAAPEVAKGAGVVDGGYRLVANQGADAGQVVAHFHLHLLAGRELGAMG
jgi:histidine triad (HIT) family protein